MASYLFYNRYRNKEKEAKQMNIQNLNSDILNICTYRQIQKLAKDFNIKNRRRPKKALMIELLEMAKKANSLLQGDISHLIANSRRELRNGAIESRLLNKGVKYHFAPKAFCFVLNYRKRTVAFFDKNNTLISKYDFILG